MNKYQKILQPSVEKTREVDFIIFRLMDKTKCIYIYLKVKIAYIYLKLRKIF
jgi:hypothetical protein